MEFFLFFSDINRHPPIRGLGEVMSDTRQLVDPMLTMFSERMSEINEYNVPRFTDQNIKYYPAHLRCPNTLKL